VLVVLSTSTQLPEQNNRAPWPGRAPIAAGVRTLGHALRNIVTCMQALG